MLRLGLRARLVIALFAMLIVAYVPLLLAVDSLMRGAARREESERALAATTWLLEATGGEPVERSRSRLARSLGTSHLVGAALFERDRSAIAEVGVHLDWRAPDTSPDAIDQDGERRIVASAERNGRVLVTAFVSPRHGEPVAATTRLIALYTCLLAVLLAALAYHQLTKLIVRPLETLSRGAERVAAGARQLEVPQDGAAELVALGKSLESMATTLLTNEDALKKKVTEVTRARAELAASERLAIVGRLAAGVAHEIGNPVAAILGMHDLMDDPDLPIEERADFLSRMRGETERVANIVRDLLDFARPEGRTTVGDATSSSDDGATDAIADVRDVALEAAKLARVQKRWRDIDVVVDVADGTVLPMHADRLKQVFVNLLLNACAALASTKHPKIEVRARSEDDCTIVVVEDNGPGIPHDLASRIFEPFVTTKDVGEGTGLGLAVCRGLVEDAGGKLILTGPDDPSDGATGARFVIRFSRKRATSRPTTPTPSHS